MTPDQLATFRHRLASARQPVERSPWSQHIHPRAWNDCLDFVERQLRDVLGEPKEGTAA